MSLLGPSAAVHVQRQYPTPRQPGVDYGTRDPGLNSKLVIIQSKDDENVVMKVLGGIRWAVRWVITGPVVPQFKSFKTLDDPDCRWASGEQVKAANASLAANQPKEDAALLKVGSARAEAFRQVAQLCAKDPVAREALQRMLLDGRLTGQKDLLGQGDMLAHLGRMATQKQVDGLNRQSLVTNLIEEMDNPIKIAQEGKGTCVATTATIVAARKNPTEIVRMVADLARPEGGTTTINGKKLWRNPDWANPNDAGRTPSLQLLQPALMELGNGWMRYENDRDVHTLAEKTMWEKVKDGFAKFRRFVHMPGGLQAGGAKKILEALTGDRYGATYIVTRPTRPFVWKNIEASLAKGKSVPIGIEWEGGGHKVLLDKIEGGVAYITNPWGEKDSISVKELRANLCDANIPK